MVRTMNAVVLAAAVAAGAITQATYVPAATKYDGPWSLVIYTKTGPCDQSYRFSGRIVNGYIVYSGGMVDFTGRVRTGGAAYAKVSSGSSYAVARGRLTASRGRGVWQGQGPNGPCAGIWSAIRG